MPATLIVPDNTNYTLAAALTAMQAVAVVTAHAGGGQASATALAGDKNLVSVCATAGDSVALPLAVAGLTLTVANQGAASCNVFAANGSTDTVNGVAGSTATAIAAGSKSTTFRCYKSAPAGIWAAAAAS